MGSLKTVRIRVTGTLADDVRAAPGIEEGEVFQLGVVRVVRQGEAPPEAKPSGGPAENASVRFPSAATLRPGPTEPVGT